MQKFLSLRVWFGIFLTSVILAGCTDMVVRPSETNSNSDVKTTMAVSEDIAPTVLRGSTKLHIDSNNVWLNDDGLQQIFVDESTSSGQTIQAIMNWIDSYKQPNKSKQIAIKQVTLSTQGSTLKIVGGSGLKEYISSVHTQVSVSGGDLLLSANPQRNGATSYLLISNSNPNNYTITNDQDRYNPGLFMINKNNYTLIKLQRSSDLEYVSLNYKTGANDYQLDTRNTLSIPKQTQIILKSDYIKSPFTAYLINFETENNQNADAKNNILNEIGLQYNKGVVENLTTQIYGIQSYSKLTNPNSSGEYNFTTTSGERQGLLLVSSAFTKLITWTSPKFEPKLIDVDIAGDYEGIMPYVKRIATNYQIDSESVDQSLIKILGTGNFQWNDGNQFSYNIQPKQTYSGTMNIKTIFGDSEQLPISFYIDSIDPRTIVKQILSNTTVSTLANSGSFQDVLVQYKNIASFPVSFTPCTINIANTFENFQGQGMENNLFDCDEKSYTTTVNTTDFKYRKAYRTPVKLPANFPTSQAFKVSIPDARGIAQVHYFYKSDIGIWTKVAGNQLHVRGMRFDDNSAIESGYVILSEIGGKQISKQSIQATKSIIPLPKDAQGNLPQEPLLLQIVTDKSSAFVIVHPQGKGVIYKQKTDKSYTINSFLDPSEVALSNQSLAGGSEYPVKIYGYSDRGLYKAGDSVFFAGFVRDLRVFDNLTYLKDKKVSISMTDPQGNSIYTNTGIALDEFGGFNGSMTLAKSMPLGDVFIYYYLNGDDQVSYSQNIKVEEYQKPTFFADLTHEILKDNLNIVIAPQYFFGQALKNYDIKFDRSLAGKDSCAYCRWWNQDPYYYNYVFNDTINTGGGFMLYGQSDPQISKSLFSQDILQQKGYQYTLKATMIIKDNTSDETQFFTKYIDFSPEVKLGLSGQPSERLYEDGAKDTAKKFTIDGEISAGKDKIAGLQYEVYYRSYDQEMQKGIDGSMYYLNDHNYQLLKSGSIDNQKNFSIKNDFISKPGSYFVRVFATDSKGAIIGEVQKQIEYYIFTQDPDGLLGSLPNNYTLTVSVPKKTYEEGDLIPIDIAPYQKGARIIMTAERGNRIIDTVETVLDGSPLTMLVKPGYAPNITISVMQMIGTDKSSGPRKEPRFLVGYAEAEISTAMHTMQIDVKSDKAEYKPGELVKLTISTKDSKGNPVDARLSLGVIDQALMALYDSIREPIPYFFNKLGSNVFTYTNMKLLYQSLRAFANNGNKGGGGDGGKAMFSVIRDDLSDLSFWRGGLYTSGGKLEVSFNLPENVTTWVVDIIGFTKDTKLGTARTTFQANKNLIVEANTPTFLTIGDSLNIPAKLIVPADKVKGNQNITLSAFIQNDSGDKVELGTFNAKPNTKVLLPTTIPNTRLSSNSVKLSIKAEYGNETDAVLQTIVLRTDGLIAKDAVGIINTEGTHDFQAPENLGGNIHLSLSQFPTNLIDPALQYLVQYPYGCTEQILSSLLPLQNIQNLIKSGKYSSSLLSGEYVQLPDGSYKVKDILTDGIASLISHQQSNGSFGRRDGKDTENSVQKYLLSAYAYGGLQELKNSASSITRIEQVLASAESYLWSNRTLSPVGFLYYLSLKTKINSKLDLAEMDELKNINPQKYPYGGLLRYVIAVNQKNNEDMKFWKPYAVIPTNQDQRTDTSIFINQTSALALKLQAFAKDPNTNQDERMQALQALLGTRNKQGLRGQSTQSNSQVLRTLATVGANRTSKENVSCDAMLGNQYFTGLQILANSGISLTQTLLSTQAKVSWKCDSLIIADSSINFIPKTLNDLLGANTNVTQMDYNISNLKAKIGDLVDINASRTTTVPGEQVAVEIFIPSTYKLLETIVSKNNQNDQDNEYPNDGNNQLPFTVSDSECQPSHRETRFDRLFLYYENLPAITCDISTQALKAYDGTGTIMPMRIYEMYKGTINGRKVIQ